MSTARLWEGVVDEALEREVLGACLDQAPERRRIREAFKDVQLNIDHYLFKAQYSGIGTKESYERNSRGVEIFSKCWFPENHRMKAIVCLCHGYGDTCTFFLEGFARKIASVGYGVFALDYPGFGLSEGLHGYIPSFDALVDDVAEHFSKLKAWEMLKTTQEIEIRLEEVSLPMIILHGEADLVTNPTVSKALYEKAKSKDKKLYLYKDAYHSILEGEPDETIFQVLNDIISWLDQHSTKQGSS